jgi:ribosomal subunit interface protein
METRITARHCEVSEALENRARAVAARLDKISPHALNATFIFDVNALDHLVELRLHARGRRVLKATGRGPDHRTALDRAEEKLRAQLEKAAAGRPRRPRQAARTARRPA